MIISNSEVQTWLTCKKRHHYAHILDLEPIEYNDSLKRGLAFHELMATYYKLKLDGITHKDAKQYCSAVKLMDLLKNFPGMDWVLLSDIQRMFFIYMDNIHVMDANFKVLDVEGFYEIPLNAALLFGLRVDLLVEYVRGPKKGQHGIIDIKTCRDFWTDAQLKMHPQLPRYSYALVKLGANIGEKSNLIRQIRYREDAVDKYRDSVSRYTPVLGKNSMSEFVLEANRLYGLKTTVSPEQSREIATRSQNTFGKYPCHDCAFFTPCYEEFDGRDSSMTLKAFYRQNTYGYKDLKPEEKNKVKFNA